MARGQEANIGAKRTAPNGYEYTKTQNGWELTHRLIAAEKLGRPLESSERTKFVDGDRTNLDPDNIEVHTVRNTKEMRIKRIKDRIKVLQRELKDLQDGEEEE